MFSFLQRLSLPLLILFGWWLISEIGLVSKLLLAHPFDVLRCFTGSGTNQADILLHLGATSARTFGALILSIILGVPFGVLMGKSKVFHRLFIFPIEFLRATPPIALFPIFILVLGIGEASKVAVPFYGCFFIMVINTIYGVSNVSEIRKRVGKTCGMGATRVLFQIELMDALPQIVIGIRTSLSLALVLSIVVEMLLGSQVGIGHMIYQGHITFNAEQMYSGIVLVGMMGYVLNVLFVSIEGRFIHWKGGK